MSSKQKYDHLSKDLKKLRYRMDYYRPKAIKEIKKSNYFPAWKTYDYIVRESNNKYVIVYYVDSPRNIEKPRELFFLDYNDDNENDHFVVRWCASPYKQTPDSPMKLVRTLHVYDSHFLKRYNERVLKNESLMPNEVASIYFSRNDIIMPIEMNEEIYRNVTKYVEFGKFGYRVNEGMCLAKTVPEGNEETDVSKQKLEAVCILYKTFLSETILKENQKYAIMKEYWDKWTKSYLNFLKENNGNDILLTLEP
jgi:hypothetical protein